MMTRREIYTLKYNQILVGPNNQVAQYMKASNFRRGRPQYLELRMVPSGALESNSIHNIERDWFIPTPEQLETIDLLFNPLDDAF